MNIIVTGGSGFIGTNLIEYFIERGHQVINVDIAEPQIVERKNIWRKLDIRDYDALRKIFLDFEPEYIVHLAARTDLNGKDINEYDANTIGVKNVLQASKEVRSLKKIIITSSMLVCKVGYIPKRYNEYAPSTLYGESKVVTETLTWNNQPKCDWAIIRPTSIWGPWFNVPYKNFFERVITKRYFHIGNRGCTKTYGYVGNAVYEIEQILFHDTLNEDNKIFYIGDYEPTNIEVWANEIANQVGYKIMHIPFWMIQSAAKFGDMLKIINIDFPMTSFRLKNMTTDNVVDMTSTEKLVKALPYDRVKGIEDTLCWMKK